MIADITKDASKKIHKATKDKKLSVLVEKMLSKNLFQTPDLQTVANLMEGKAKDIIPKKKGYARDI